MTYAFSHCLVITYKKLASCVKKQIAEKTHQEHFAKALTLDIFHNLFHSKFFKSKNK